MAIGLSDTVQKVLEEQAVLDRDVTAHRAVDGDLRKADVDENRRKIIQDLQNLRSEVEKLPSSPRRERLLKELDDDITGLTANSITVLDLGHLDAEVDEVTHESHLEERNQMNVVMVEGEEVRITAAAVRQINEHCRILESMDPDNPDPASMRALALNIAGNDPVIARGIEAHMRDPHGRETVITAARQAHHDPAATKAALQDAALDKAALVLLLSKGHLSPAKRKIVEEVLLHELFTVGIETANPTGHRLVMELNDGSADLSSSAQRDLDAARLDKAAIKAETRVAGSTDAADDRWASFVSETVGSMLITYRKEPAANKPSQYNAKQVADLKILNNPASSRDDRIRATLHLVDGTDGGPVSKETQALLHQGGPQALREGAEDALREGKLGNVLQQIQNAALDVQRQSKGASDRSFFDNPLGYTMSGVYRHTGGSFIDEEFEDAAAILNRTDPVLVRAVGKGKPLTSDMIMKTLVTEGMIPPKPAFNIFDPLNSQAAIEKWNDHVRGMFPTHKDEQGHLQLNTKGVAEALRKATLHQEIRLHLAAAIQGTQLNQELGGKDGVLQWSEATDLLADKALSGDDIDSPAKLKDALLRIAAPRKAQAAASQVSLRANESQDVTSEMGALKQNHWEQQSYMGKDGKLHHFNLSNAATVMADLKAAGVNLDTYDKDRSGHIELAELGSAMRAAQYHAPAASKPVKTH